MFRFKILLLYVTTLVCSFRFQLYCLSFSNLYPFVMDLLAARQNPCFYTKFTLELLWGLANFDCLKQLYLCRKCLSTNSCLTFDFFYCSLEAKKAFYPSNAKYFASTAGVLLFHCQIPALPLPHFCSSFANWLLFHCHIFAHPTPNGYFVPFSTYLPPFLLFHCQLACFCT